MFSPLWQKTRTLSTCLPVFCAVVSAIMNDMKRWMLVFMLLLAACSGTPAPVLVVPTLAELPTETPTLIPPSGTPTELPSAAPSSTATLSPSATIPPSETPSPLPSETAIPSETPTPEPSQTFTPSLTITNTITPTPSQTFTPMPELDGLGMLALLIERATVLPPEMMYNPPTLTAVAYLAQTHIAGGSSFGATPTPVSGTPVFGTLPPVSVNCSTPPPASLIAADAALTQLLGCPVGSITSTVTAVQSFERGSMLYIQGSPNYIYVLTYDGRFRRYDDTWIAGVDPESGGETPPLGLLEPRRGFGKVWRSNPDARGALGWAINDEQGASSPLLLFDRGRAVFLPQRGESYLMSDDPGGLSGTWHAVAAGF